MAKQTFTTGQVLTAAQMTSLQQTAMLGGSATAKTTSYVLVAADAGTTVAMNAAGATTITVNTGLFAAGDTVFIQNLGAGACTVTAGTATVATAGSLILPQNDAGILYFTATGASIFYDFIQAGGASPLTTKGDVYGFSTSDARIPIGANDTVLTADSAQALGLKWAAPAAGGGMTLLQSLALTGATVTSSTLSSAYKQYFIYIKSCYGSVSDEMKMRLNADTGSNYAYHLAQFAAVLGVYRSSSATSLNIGTVASQSAVTKSSNFGVYITTPSDTNNVMIQSHMLWGDATLMYQEIMQGIYDSAAAITSITLFPLSGTFTSGTAYIYGVN